MFRNARPLISWSIRPLELWRYALAIRSCYFKAFKEGVKSLPRLSKLTYAREWPQDRALNILEPGRQGPYPEALDDYEASFEDDWCGLRFVVETLKEVNASGRTLSLDLRTPMAS